MKRVNTKLNKRELAMKSWAIFTLFLSAVLFGSISVSAKSSEDILVIANGSVKSEKVTQDDLRDIFLKKRMIWSSGIRAVPIHSKNAALRNDFRERLLKMSQGEEARYWQRLQIQKGEGKLASFDNTLKAVFRIKGAVSYIYRSQYIKGVTNVLLVLPAVN